MEPLEKNFLNSDEVVQKIWEEMTWEKWEKLTEFEKARINAWRKKTAPWYVKWIGKLMAFSWCVLLLCIFFYQNIQLIIVFFIGAVILTLLHSSLSNDERTRNPNHVDGSMGPN